MFAYTYIHPTPFTCWDQTGCGTRRQTEQKKGRRSERKGLERDGQEKDGTERKGNSDGDPSL